MKKTSAKILALLLALMLSLSIFTVAAFAAGVSVTMNSPTVTVDSTTTVNVSLPKNSNVAGGDFTIQYDNAKLTVTAVAKGGLLDDETSFSKKLDASANTFKFSFAGTKGLTTAGVVAKITFKGKAAGSAALKFTACDLYDVNGMPMSATPGTATVTVNAAPTNYTITFDGNGGTPSQTTKTVTAGSAVGTLPSATRSLKITYNANGGANAPAAQTVALTCKGWATTKTGSPISTSWKPSGNTTLYAVWETPVTATLSSAVPTRSGYTFKGWAKSSGATTAAYQKGATISDLSANITLYAVWEKLPDNPTANAALNVKASASVDYKADVTITATATGVPSGYVVALYDGNTQIAKGDNASVSYHVGNMTASKTYNVKIVDANGNVQKDGSGNDLSKNVEVTVNTGFFAKIVAFFRGLFGSLPKVEIKP